MYPLDPAQAIGYRPVHDTYVGYNLSADLRIFTDQLLLCTKPRRLR